MPIMTKFLGGFSFSAYNHNFRKIFDRVNIQKIKSFDSEFVVKLRLTVMFNEDRVGV